GRARRGGPETHQRHSHRGGSAADAADHVVTLDPEVGGEKTRTELVADDDAASRYIEPNAQAGEPGVFHLYRHSCGDAGRVQDEPSGAVRALLAEGGCRDLAAREAHDVVTPPRPAPFTGDIDDRPPAEHAAAHSAACRTKRADHQQSPRSSPATSA